MLARMDTPVHRLDPRAKVLTTGVFILCVVSFDKYTIGPMLPFLIFPLAMLILAMLPPGYMLSRLLPAVPFVFFVAVFNPFLDRDIMARPFGVELSGGWISFTSILLRFFLTVLAAMILIATTGLYAICLALQRFHLPRPFLVQTLLLYRYIFILVEEALRLVRAYRLRATARRGIDFGAYKTLLGNLLLRSIDRAQNIHKAMLSRGFDGRVHLTTDLRFGPSDWAFVLGWSAFFLLARFVNLPLALGQVITGGTT